MSDPIETLAGGSPAPRGEGRACEFCGCQLTERGEVLRMSEQARQLRTLEERLLKEQTAHAETAARLAAAENTIAELRAQLAPPAAPSRKSWGF